jgi:hypothetical protein
MPLNSRIAFENVFDDVAGDRLDCALATSYHAAELKTWGLEICLMTWRALCISPYDVVFRENSARHAWFGQPPGGNVECVQCFEWSGGAGSGRGAIESKHSTYVRSPVISPVFSPRL